MISSAKIAAFRKQLPQIAGRIYFNHGVISLTPKQVADASCVGVRAGMHMYVDPKVRQKWWDIRSETRAMCAGLIGAKADDIAFVQSTSAALSLVSLSIPWKSGDNVVSATVENPATVVPWQNLSHLGVSVKYAPAGADDQIDVNKVIAAIDERTRVVALSLVEYSTGQRLNIKKICAYCKPRNILVSIDAVQAVGAIPVDVQDLGVNFLSTGALKWLLGPVNIGFIYVDPVTAQLIRSPILTESNVTDIKLEEEESSTGSPPQLNANQGALKLEAMPYLNFPGVYGLHRALTTFAELGKDNIYARIKALTDELIVGLQRMDLRVVSPRGADQWSGLVAFETGGVPTRQVVDQLRARQVFVAMRKGRIRASPHFYNTSAEVRAFLKELAQAMTSSRTSSAGG
ncbi:MAG: aminotransferase class V-fold PLP-dependent enzyme [Planctomycetota bacterium]